jgi:hypothetical protein
MFQANVVEKIKIDILCPTTFFVDRVVCEIMWKNIVEQDRPQITISSMRTVCG